MKIFLYLAAAATIFAMPSSSGAELKGEATAGLGLLDIDRESFKYGEYTGLSHDRMFFAGSADISYGRGLYYLDLKAKDLGLDNRGVLLQSGVLRKYDAFINYSEIPHLINNNSRTPFTGAGTANLVFPSTLPKGANTSNLNSLNDVPLELHRKKLSLGLSDNIGHGVGVSVAYSHETKDGVKSIGGLIGSRATVLPEPVDYEVNEITAKIGWKGQSSNAELEYNLSFFDNNTGALTWDNPFTSAASPMGRISLPPDNFAQRIGVTGGTSLPFYSTRVSFAAQYGMMEQDETLLPFSIAPSAPASAVPPRRSAQAEIATKLFTLDIASRPAPRLGVNLKYRYYSTDNNTPMDLFRYIRTDGAAQVSANSALYSLPYDYTQQKASLDGSYYLGRATTFRAGYDFEKVDRSFREINETEENTFRATLQSGFFEKLSLGLNGSYSDRYSKDPYDQFNLYSQLHTNPAANGFDNNLLLRKFDIAERTRKKAGATAAWFPVPNVTVAAAASYASDEYGESELGLRNRRTDSYTADLSWAPADAVSIYGYYTKDLVNTRQESRAFTTKDASATGSENPLNNWSARHFDNIDTVGVGTSVGFIENRLVVKADYSYSRSVTEIRFDTAGSTPPQEVPPLASRVHSVDLTGTYRVNGKISVGAGYKYENYKSQDFAVDGVEPGSDFITEVYTLSGRVPDYEAQQGMVFVTYRFGAEK